MLLFLWCVCTAELAISGSLRARLSEKAGKPLRKEQESACTRAQSVKYTEKKNITSKSGPLIRRLTERDESN